MDTNSVGIDVSTTPSTITYAPTFNVAVPFVDRHLTEGRADKVVVRSVGGGQITYGELAKTLTAPVMCCWALASGRANGS